MAAVLPRGPDSLTESTWVDEVLQRELDSLMGSMWTFPSEAEALLLAPDSMTDLKLGILSERQMGPYYSWDSKMTIPWEDR